MAYRIAYMTLESKWQSAIKNGFFVCVYKLHGFVAYYIRVKP